MADNPSLKARLPEAIEAAFRYARREAANETGLDDTSFPPECPWTFEQIMAADFWPEDERQCPPKADPRPRRSGSSTVSAISGRA
jgi:hypothetical protein